VPSQDERRETPNQPKKQGKRPKEKTPPRNAPSPEPPTNDITAHQGGQRVIRQHTRNQESEPQSPGFEPHLERRTIPVTRQHNRNEKNTTEPRGPGLNPQSEPLSTT
jgi:hypothetical protein